MRGTVASIAKQDLQAGHVLDGEGGYTVYGKALPVDRAGNALPVGLAQGVPLTRAVRAGELVTFDHVDLAQDAIANLYRSSLSQV